MPLIRLDRVRWLLLSSVVAIAVLPAGHALFAWADKTPEAKPEASTAPDKRDASDALAALDVGKGLEATLFAAEPMLLSPSNIDIDHRGRVWVCEVVNYRGRSGSRPEGDRILILEDTNHDGKADKSTVFHQGRDIDSAMGICVLGNKVIVSVAPNVFVFTDTNGDGKSDKKEVLFSNVGQPQHDHSAHAFVFGPDGKLYWNFGNTGHSVHDKDGKPIKDLAGNIVVDDGKPYRQGLVFRCNLDGSDFEVLGNNFRNNYEVSVDSFGTLWQSDNDDDGNRGVRINYVMEFGNYGYVDEMTGASWKVPRTGLEGDISSRHWHLNDPGVIPNLLHTGNGSPTGICLYEGKLLPSVFRNQIIHCDAGPNICRAYPVTNDGAGYKGTIENVLAGARDNWFRPSDVCVAPDGSLIIADWYDPGVGGHRMGDIDKGRLFRIAPPKTPYRCPTYDFSSADGAIAALQSPNLDARYLAWTKLNSLQEKAEPALLKLYRTSDDPRYRARALWLLTKIPARAKQHIETALKDPDSDIRITALRAARELKWDVIPYVAQLAHDPSPQVRRECAIALRHNSSPDAAQLWAELAAQHDGRDRWYLEALGIGADKQWDRFLDAWLARVGDKWNGPVGRDIIWRSRAAVTPDYLLKIIADPSTGKDDLPRYFRAFDFLKGAEKDKVMAQLAFAPSATDEAKREFIVSEALGRVEGADFASHPEQRAALEKVLDKTAGTYLFLRLVDKFNVAERYPAVLALAQKEPATQIGVEAMRLLLAKKQTKIILAALDQKDLQIATNTAKALGYSGDGQAATFLMALIADSKKSPELRQEAVRDLTKMHNGAVELLRLIKAKQLDETLVQTAAFSLHAVNWDDIKQQASELFPLPASKDEKPLPPLNRLVRSRGDSDKGKVVFNTVGKCNTCHIVKNEGKEVGPNLSEIGGKLSREAMFESILFPSAGISHNYETYAIELTSGNVENGILTEQTADAISLKGADAIVRTFKKSEIEAMKKQSVSLMPADLQKTMSSEELVNVVEYLMTLKKEQQ